MEFIEKCITVWGSLKLIGFLVSVLLFLVYASFLVVLHYLDSKRRKQPLLRYAPPSFKVLVVVALTIGLPITASMMLFLFCKKAYDALFEKETPSI